MQNYAYDRNYNRVNRYVYGARASSYARTFRYIRRVLAAILLLTIGALVSDKAVALYKGVAGCFIVLFLLGVVGGIESGSVSLAIGSAIAFTALGFVVYIVAGKRFDV